MKASRSALVTRFVVGVTIGGLVGAIPAAAAAAAANLLVIVSDTLRADVLGCYGGAAETPNLCALAERGVLFESAYANAPWTLPSSVALFTGNYPDRYKVTGEVEAGPKYTYRVRPEERLLAEDLRATGYEVDCWIENSIAGQAKTLQGFSDRTGAVVTVRPELARKVGYEAEDERSARVLWLVDALLSRPEGPFFFLHWISDPHAVYRPPPGVLEGQDLPERLPRGLDFYLGLGHRDEPEAGYRKLRDHTERMTAAEVDLLERLYALEVESVDRRVGYLLRALEEAELHSERLVVFTSDHGEGFGEHGGFLHGNSLYNELVRVPLIIAGPGIVEGRRVTTPVSHIDLMPTLYDLLGLAEHGDHQGESLRDLITGGEAGAARLHYLTNLDRGVIDAVVLRRYKLIGNSVDDGFELYDLATDPGESRDRSADLPDVAAELWRGLLDIRRENELGVAAGDDAAAEAGIRRKTLEQLRALGYVD